VVPSAGELRLYQCDFDDFSLESDDMLLAAIRIFHDARLISSFSIDYDVCKLIYQPIRFTQSMDRSIINIYVYFGLMLRLFRKSCDYYLSN